MSRAVAHPRGRRWRRILAGLLAGVAVPAAVTAWVLTWPVFGGRLEGERLKRAQASPQYRDDRFHNHVPQAAYTWANVQDLLRGQFLGDEQRQPSVPLPSVVPDLSRPAPAAPSLRAFWVGHGSVFIEIDGLRLLVDPMFSEYASPFPLGPRRFQPPPVALAELPKVDLVLVTHDHYDHLDMASVQALAARGSRFLVPLGIGAHLQRWGVPAAQVQDMAWGDAHTQGGVRIVSAPSRHYSGRGLTDADATLWSAWVVRGMRHRFYVSGDTGFSDHFARTGTQHGPFDLAFIKVGAYGPGQPWVDIHMTPEDAVRAQQALKAHRMFPVHWGTFNLAFHDWDEPIRRTLSAARAAGTEVVAPRLGEWVDADQPFAGGAWWETVR